LKVSGRLADFAKQRRRAESRIDRSEGAERASETRPDGDGFHDRRGSAAAGETGDPAAAADYREMMACLAEALIRLDDTARWIVEEWIHGAPLLTLAGRLAIPYHRVQARWREILSFLRGRLAAWAD
jgi:hypothetical protein